MIERVWSLEWRGRTFRSSELSGRHAAVVAELLGAPPQWATFVPARDEMHPAAGPLQTIALLAAFTIVADGVTGDDARRKIMDTFTEATVDELVDAIRIED